MAVDVSLSPVVSGYKASTINANFEKIKEALGEAVSRTGGVPNYMEASLDMNGNSLLNVSKLSASVLTLNGQQLAPSELVVTNALLSNNNLSDVGSVSLSRTNLKVNVGVQEVAVDRTVTASDINKLLRCTAGVNLFLDLSTSLTEDFTFSVKAENGDVTIAPALGSLIDGEASVVVTSGTSASIYCDGTDFYSVRGGGGQSTEGSLPVGARIAWDMPTPPSGLWLMVSSPTQVFSRTLYPQLFDLYAPEMSATITSGSTTVTKTSGTWPKGTKVGMSVEGTGIPPNTTIASIGISNTLTLSQPATDNGSSIRIFFYGNGDGSTTCNVPPFSGRYGLAFDEFSQVNPDASILGDTLADAMQRITGDISVRNATVIPSGSDEVFTGSSPNGGPTDTSPSFSTTGQTGTLNFDSANSPGARTADRTRPMTYVTAYIIKAADGIDDPSIVLAADYVTEVNRLTGEVDTLTTEVDSLTRGVSGHVTNVSEVVIDLSGDMESGFGEFELDMLQAKVDTSLEYFVFEGSQDGGLSWITSYELAGYYITTSSGTISAVSQSQTAGLLSVSARNTDFGTSFAKVYLTPDQSIVQVQFSGPDLLTGWTQGNISSVFTGGVNAIRIRSTFGNIAELRYSLRKIRRP